MFIKGEVKCYHCGFVSGELLADRHGDVQKGQFSAVPSCVISPHGPRGRLRCCRCGGPVFLDDVTQVRQRGEPVATGDDQPLRERTAEQ